MSERFYYLGFSLFKGVGPILLEKLLNRFGSAQNAWNASHQDLAKVLKGKLAYLFEEFRSDISLSEYHQKLQSEKILFITILDKEYPKLLREIKRPPFLLFVKALRQAQGKVNFNEFIPSIGVVGTRKITSYGREVTEMFTRDLVNAGFTIISGLAYGIDAISHQTAIENGGKTIAVLGCGVDCCTPPSNQKLYDEIIASGGAIVSELPLGHRPTKGSFPARNRIIAGLSKAVLVTEGAEDSGALITADYAFQFNRKVFAVPGPITSSLSKGPFKLISRGAQLVTTASDILSTLGSSGSRIKNSELRIKKGDTKEEIMILKLLENEPLHFDEIVKRTGLDSSKIGSLLSLMEIKGFIKLQPTGFFSIAS